VRAEVPGQSFRDAQLYLWRRVEHQACGCLKNYTQASKKVKDWLGKKDEDGKFINGERDDKGNQVFWFPKEITAADGVEYSGVMLKAKPGEAYFDDAEVMDFARRKGLAERVIRTVQVIDEEELYVLYQEGEITETELRDLTHYAEPSYSLWPVKTAEALDE
jgi:hypothetical protein